MLSIFNGFWELCLQLFINPFWIVIFLLPAFQISLERIKERQIFGKRLYAPTPLILRTWYLGVITSLFLSLILLNFKFTIRAEEVFLVWACMLFLAIWRIRFACFSYAVGILSILSPIVKLLDHSKFISVYGNTWWEVIAQFSINQWLWLVCLTHLMECGLIRMAGTEGSLPVQIPHRVGRIVSGFQICKIWPMPIVVFTMSGWLAIPLMIGFESKSCLKPISQQQRLSSTYVFVLSICIGCLLALSYGWKPLLWMAVLLSLCGHEVFYWWGKRVERQKEPRFVSDEKGLRVLAVLPQTPAAEMGLKSGDIIHKLNGVRISTLEELKQVVEGTAFLKIEVCNDQMDSHFVQKALYEDDPKDLGIIGATPVWGTNKGIH
ncbi:PDZ domain-containing protein [Thermoflavimicrobium daqui]|uniref:PDZ domain-containing protein n=1 Tax=Thermoflavimicrobium daqui TaxID=2137476 RepID=A0A364K563_9BACL|nr:PDZ domain-containing protein [Thermoflavimicrobium daqui]RAL24520.1 hypothetical protein DL897_09430 [Thermoflavimicrobium daqui]